MYFQYCRSRLKTQFIFCPTYIGSSLNCNDRNRNSGCLSMSHRYQWNCNCPVRFTNQFCAVTASAR